MGKSRPIYKSMLVLHEENFLWLKWKVVLQVLQKERVGTGEKVIRLGSSLNVTWRSLNLVS